MSDALVAELLGRPGSVGELSHDDPVDQLACVGCGAMFELPGNPVVHLDYELEPGRPERACFDSRTGSR